MGTNKSYHIEGAKERGLHKSLKSRGFTFSSAPHAFWRATDGNITLTFYKKGTFLIQGSDVAHHIVDDLIQEQLITLPKQAKGSKRMGTDEAGKGDYFGPLAVAGVMVTEITEHKLFTLGVKDSKRLSRHTIEDLAQAIKELSPHSVVSIAPERYNILMSRMKNVNRLLAWGHARAIENILEKEQCNFALSDQFGNERYIISALMKKGKRITLEQRPHAEEDIAVAAASILARNEFTKRLDDLSASYDMVFPKGASDEEVIPAARKFIITYGNDALKKVAKIHFKTTKKVVSS